MQNKCSNIPAAAALLMRTLWDDGVYGKGEGRGRVALASMEYKNSPIVSFRKMTEHWRSPTEKGKKSTSTSAEE